MPPRWRHLEPAVSGFRERRTLRYDTRSERIQPNLTPKAPSALFLLWRPSPAVRRHVIDSANDAPGASLAGVDVLITIVQINAPAGVRTKHADDAGRPSHLISL